MISDDNPPTELPCQLGPEDCDGVSAGSQVKNAKQTDHGVETKPPKGLTEQKGSQDSSEEGHSNDKAGESPLSGLQPREDKKGHELKTTFI